MNFAITIVSPPKYPHAAAFREIAETLEHALRSLGHDALVTTEGMLPGRRHIVLGSNLLQLQPMQFAGDAIFYNLEQVAIGSVWFPPALLDTLRRHTVWDYSRRNAALLEAAGVRVAQVVPVGYAPVLTRIEPAAERDIDVLFYGTLSRRRAVALARMRKEEGLEVMAGFGLYGRERDALIARAKLVLNLHHYDAKVLEIVRISYLLANRCAVLSERSADPEDDAALAGGVAFAAYEELPRRAAELVRAPAEREALARRGFEIMSARPAAAYLQAALAARP